MTAPRAVLMALLLAAAGGSALSASQGAPRLFPHERHAKVFPVCEGCHAGIVSGEQDDVFPAEQVCQRCHDGERQARVGWRDPAPRISNLRYSHTQHRRTVALSADSTTCLSCHAVTDPPQRMVVAAPRPSQCVACHTNGSAAHIAPTARCRTCHVSLVEAPRVPVERVARFPKPAWHDEADFGAEHGRVPNAQAASCAVCHARESCERCHANADRIPLIASLARDARVSALVAGKEATYLSPRSHDDGAWRTGHGASARTAVDGCANCHTRPSCEACHAGGSGTSRTAIASLPGPGVREGLGVSPARINRAVHPQDIVSRHGTLAASGGMDCAQCHNEQTCASCHAAPDSRRFHAGNFVERHAVEVFAAGTDCQSCHNTERFCRDCHARTGIAASARMTAAFHTGKANWVLSHGQAARTGMESCASCHRQADCVRCHSASGGWGVNPHRPGYQAGAIGARNSASCRWCHLGALPGGGS